MTLPDSVLARQWWRQPSFGLILALCASLVMYPFADIAKPLRTIAQLVDVVVVLIVVRLIRANTRSSVSASSEEHISTSARMFTSGWILSIPLLGLQAAHLFTSQPSVELALLVMQVVFFGYAVLALLVYVLADDIVTLDELFALEAIYVLIALLWASAYAIVVHFAPDAIFINSTNNSKNHVSFADLVYYSMTTLTSTGYGEITPVHPAARALAMLQQWAGVMFVGILIARLAGMHRFYKRAPADTEKQR
jgi:Ion channel